MVCYLEDTLFLILIPNTTHFTCPSHVADLFRALFCKCLVNQSDESFQKTKRNERWDIAVDANEKSSEVR